MVHRLRDLSNRTEAVDREMQSLSHHVEDRLELDELLELGRSQWAFFEERHHDVNELPALLIEKRHRDARWLSWR